MIIEHNGDIYSCDHYVYPDFRLGNMMETPLIELAGSEQQQKFGSDKFDRLTEYCKTCDVRFACNGDCPKHRLAHTPDGEPGLSWLCKGYKMFMHHIDPAMQTMARLLRENRPAADIMIMMTR